ncbi:hypothetical protein IAE33_001693 [Pseudomonas sp. S60]|uniref:hypothetical protein n=1 Tax=Pseudomonas sp. S60 TaxID=211124 RepID=UPI001914AAB0|nr:hypothetical protein [Pseudomonas sp. S60]MBK5009833.1 hypothetical protein [Pseudomonas sp. S60]
MIQTCAEIHQQLWYAKNFAVAQGYGKHPRDEALLQRLAEKLGVPDESFISSGESKNITAQQYLMAMLETLEPLSVMFEGIWRYCERTLTKTSRDALDISWNFNLHGERITINFEAFRRYRQLLMQLPPAESFNTLSNAFADACRNYQLPEWPSELPSKPRGALSTGVASRIYDLCELVLAQGLNDCGYWGTKDVIAKLWAIRDQPLWHANAFFDLRQQLDQCTPALTPEDILSLPFWRQRWQIYELWCLVTTLSLFESRGFELTRSPTGASLLELGRSAVIAERKSDPLGQIVYQPTYQRRTGQTVHPDIVVVRGAQARIKPDDVAAIIECKQHKMPDDVALKVLKKRYFDGVAASYSDAIAADGELVLVNYDHVDFAHAYTLVDDFKPETHHKLEFALETVLTSFSAYAVQPMPVLVIDGSASMASVQTQLREKIALMQQRFGTASHIIWLADEAPVVMDVDALDETSFSGSESVELFMQGLQAAQQLGSLTVAHIITDLSPHDRLFSELSQACTGIAFQVHSV